MTTPAYTRVLLGILLDDLVAHISLRKVKSLHSVLSHLKPIREHFGGWKALAMFFRAIDSYIEMRLRADGCTPATINRETQLLGQALISLGLRHLYEEMSSSPNGFCRSIHERLYDLAIQYSPSRSCGSFCRGPQHVTRGFISPRKGPFLAARATS